MRHGISEQEWLALIDGTTALHRAAALRQHAAACAECGATLAQLEHWQQEMSAEALRLRHCDPLSSTEVEQLLEVTLDRLSSLRPRDWAPAPEWRIDQALCVLRTLMVPYCGPGAAAATIALASRKVICKPETNLTARTWPGFVATLSDCFGSVCGLAAGRLVGIAGTLLAVKEG
ncbi:hypothetical protein [Paludibaculum fermentans]|uniref:hypothetical protein n=1 Tax=Paludibaculum fermentans TaxID=1473598 RepID=UPI003EC021CD